MLIPFLLLFFILAIGAYYSKIRYIKRSSVHLALFFCFILLQVLRVHCQQDFPDIPEYRDLYRNIPDLFTVLSNGGIFKYFGTENTLEVEIGYNVFMSVMKCFTSDYSLYLFAVSSIQFIVLYYFCNQSKVSILNILPAYVCLTYTAFQIGMLRQSLAFCVLLIAILNIRRKWYFLLMILIGYSFHRSMLFCILLLWIDKSINVKYIIYVFIGSLLVYLLQIELINDIWGRFLADDSNRVNFYLGVDRDNNFLGIGFWERVLEFSITTYLFTKLKKKYLRNENTKSIQSEEISNRTFSKQNYIWRMNVFYNLGVCLVLLQMIFYSSPTITSRLRYYIVLFPALFICEYIRMEIPNNKKVLYTIPLYLYFALYMYTQSGYLRGLVDNV